MKRSRITRRWSISVATALVLSVQLIGSWSYAAPATAPSTTKTSKPEELEQLVAPIALYPDSLLSQVLMASTYPMECVMAQRWVASNKTLKGDALTKALESQSWDPTVKSLVNFPDTLVMMSEKLDWTIKLGDAFIAQQKDVLDAVQRLRNKAQAAGNLASNEQQKVTAQPASTTQPSTTQIITIEPTNPQVVYVPTYNPTVVYGSWPYPSYPPYYYYPPGYTARPGVWFGAGLALGAAWGYAWGGCNWGHGDVDVDINRNTNINTKIDRDKYKNQINNRNPGGAQGKVQPFLHDASHRRGVTYRDQSTAQKFGGASPGAVQARDSYRGRAEAGQADIARGGVKAPALGGSAAAGNRPSTPVNRPTNTPANRPTYSPPARSTATNNRFDSTNTRSAFNGSQNSGNATRNASNRGQVSRQGGGGSRPSGGGGARPSGGGARAGGARAGGARR